MCYIHYFVYPNTMCYINLYIPNTNSSIEKNSVTYHLTAHRNLKSLLSTVSSAPIIQAKTTIHWWVQKFASNTSVLLMLYTFAHIFLLALRPKPISQTHLHLTLSLRNKILVLTEFDSNFFSMFIGLWKCVIPLEIIIQPLQK